MNNKTSKINLIPKKEIWEQLGFTFNNNKDNCILSNITLPEGWYLQETDHSIWTNILDQNGMIRGNIFNKPSINNIETNIYLNKRYKVCIEYVDGCYETIEIYFGNEQEKLFFAGQIYRKKGITSEELSKAYELEKYLIRKTIEWANTNYPNWEDVTAYWDKPTKKNILTKTKQK